VLKTGSSDAVECIGLLKWEQVSSLLIISAAKMQIRIFAVIFFALAKTEFSRPCFQLQ